MNTFSIGLILHVVDRLTSPLRNITRETERLGKTFNSVSDACSKFSRGFEVLTKTIERAEAPFKKLREQADQIKNIGQSLALKGTANLMIGLAPTVNAAEFEKGMAEVATLTDMSVKEIQEKYGKQVLDLSIELGQDPAIVVKGLYQAISAGIDPKEAIGFMRQAGKAAIAGVSDIFTATDLATSIKNAFNVPASEMGKVFDIIFKTVVKGKTTFPEIAHSFQQVGAAAASAGISLEHVQAAVAQMTLGGVTTERAYTSLKYAIDALVAPADKAKKIFEKLGVEVNAETVRQKDLLGIMIELKEAMKGFSEKEQAEMIADIFGSQEAQMFVKDFMTNTEKYKEMLKDIKNSTGATEDAYRKMSETTAHHYEKIKETFKVIRIALGATLLPVLSKMILGFKAILMPVAEFAQRHKTLSGILLGGVIAISAAVAGLGVLGIALGMAIRGYTNLRIAISLFTAHKWRMVAALRAMTAALIPNIKAVAMWGANIARITFTGLLSGLRAAVLGIRTLSLTMVTTPFGWIMLGITALVAAGYLLYRHWNRVSKALSSAWSWLRENWKKLLQIFMWINPILMPIMALNRLVKYVFGIDLFSAGKKIIETLWKGMKSVAMKPVEVIKDIAKKIRNFLPFSPAKEGPLRDIHKIRLIETIAEGMNASPLVNAMRQVLEPVKAFAQPLIQPVKQVLEPVKAFAQPLIQPVKQVLEPVRATGSAQPTMAGALNITVHYSPSINISQATAQAKEDLMAVLRKHQAELLKLIQEAQAKAQRVAY